MKRIRIILFIIPIITAVITPTAYAGDTITIPRNREMMTIQKHVGIYVDKTGTTQLQDILTGRTGISFKRNEKGTKNFGYSPWAYWIKIRVQRDIKDTRTWYLRLDYPHIDRVEFYRPGYSGRYEKIITGDTVPFKLRDVINRTFLFRLHRKAEPVTYYLRLSTVGSITFPLTLITNDRQQEIDNAEHIIHGIFFGTFLVMILYNLFIFFSIRDRVYLIYALLLLSGTFFELGYTGIGNAYIWQDMPAVNNIVDLVGTHLIIFFLGFFTIDFLDTRRNNPVLHTAILITAIMSGVLSILVFMVPRSYLLIPANILIIIMMALLIITAVVSLIRGNPQAKIFLPAWFVLLSAILLLALYRFAITPSSLLSQYITQVGVVINVVILSFGLTNKINTLKNELIRVNTRLEQNVAERTSQLNSAMENLATANNDLTLRHKELLETQTRAHHDMQMAVNVQTGFLAKTPPVSDDWDCAFFFEPMKGVSGDFYDFYSSEDGTLLGAGIFDVSGHGIASGLITMLAKSIIYNSFINGKEKTLHDVADEINRILQKEIGSVDHHLTGILLRFMNDSIEYVNAAHNDIIIKSGDDIYQPQDRFERTRGSFMGISDFSVPFSSLTFPVRRDDILLLYTDGLNESRNIYDQCLTVEKIMTALRESGNGSAQDIIEKIVTLYRNTMNNQLYYSDDITIMVLKKK
ncbi:MAG TPA: 7TM diverse intracellular signaling domain-containing protein [Spirochaetota bacterium]|nr:7TM diverse intracellular signaling domain-containing protein [Spirochaetota bacterium]